MKKILASSILILFAIAGFVFFSHSQKAAASTSGDVVVAVSTGCVSYVDGSPGSTYLDVPFGADVSLTVTNNDGSTYQNITGGSINTSVAPNTKTTYNQTVVSLSQVYRPVTLTFTPVAQNSNTGFVNYCPQGSGVTTSSIVINPATASLACAISGSQWKLTGDFSGNSLGTGIYNGSNLIASISPGTISESVSASSSAQTFNVIDGANYGGKGTSIASSTCPAYIAPTVGSSASKSTSSSSKTSSSINSSSSSSGSPNSSNTSTNSSVKISTVEAGTMKLDTSKPIEISPSQPLVLSGTTVPFGVVTLTIHSTPRTVTTNADKNGNWSYTVTSLANGSHIILASVKDPSTGKSTQPTQILAFSVGSLAAHSSNNKRIIYIVLVVLATILIIAGGVWYFWYRKRNMPPPIDPTMGTPTPPTSPTPIS